MTAVVQLAGDEHVGAIQSRGAHRFADLAFVAVHLRGVDVAIADLQRCADRVRGVLGIDLKDAESELRDRAPVIEGERRNRGRGGVMHRKAPGLNGGPRLATVRRDRQCGRLHP